MKFSFVVAVAVAFLAFIGIAPAAQFFTTTQESMPSVTPAQTIGSTSPVQIAERLFTAPVVEPNGFVAVCHATNLDTVARNLVAQIIDARGVEVTQTSSCGTQIAAGVTCDSSAHFGNNLALRCAVGTSGRAAALRGGMTTSSGPFPFTSPANLTVPAQ